MSVNFWIPEAPKDAEIVECDFIGCVPGNRCGYCADGLDVIDTSEAPRANFAEANAHNLLVLLGEVPTQGVYGSWTLDQMPIIRRAIMRAKAGSRSHLIREASESYAVRVVNGGDVPTIERGCSVIDCGNTDEQTMRRLSDLEKVVVYAQEHGWEVHWG
jgi:hypothetical protein